MGSKISCLAEDNQGRMAIARHPPLLANAISRFNNSNTTLSFFTSWLLIDIHSESFWQIALKTRRTSLTKNKRAAAGVASAPWMRLRGGRWLWRIPASTLAGLRYLGILLLPAYIQFLTISRRGKNGAVPVDSTWLATLPNANALLTPTLCPNASLIYHD